VRSLFGWLVADGWCWFVLREEYCWLVGGGWFVLREKYCWLVADKPSEQAGELLACSRPALIMSASPPLEAKGRVEWFVAYPQFKASRSLN
jgi:hypothetical protein